MKGILLFFGVLVLLSSFVYAECVVPYDGMVINRDTTFCEGDYYLPNGISIGANDVVLDCNGASLNGDNYSVLWSNGVYIEYKSGIIVKNCNLEEFYEGIRVFHSSNILLSTNIASDSYTHGIEVSNSDHITLNYNIANSSKGSGIVVSYSSNNVLTNNVGDLNNDNGFWLHFSENNQLINNTAEGNIDGITFWKSETNNLLGNTIDNNKRGVRMDNSPNNTIGYNNIFNNIDYNLYTDSNDLIAEYNYFGLLDCSQIDAKIFDYYDRDSLGIVDYEPYLNAPYPLGSPITCDQDNDGIPNNEDKCPDTILPEIFSQFGLNRYADIDGDKIFETKDIVKRITSIVDSEFNLTDTHGCSCKQILDLKPAKDKEALKKACTKSIINTFIKEKAWAKNLF